MEKHQMEEMVSNLIKYTDRHQDEVNHKRNSGLSPEEFEIFSDIQNAIETAQKILRRIPEVFSVDNEQFIENIQNLLTDCVDIMDEYADDISDKSLAKILIMIGFLSASAGLSEDSEQIFKSLKTMRPDSEYPLIGVAVSKMTAGNLEAAVEILRDQALQKKPDSDIAKAFLALAYTHLKRSEETQNLTKEILERNADQDAVNLATAIIEGLQVEA